MALWIPGSIGSRTQTTTTPASTATSVTVTASGTANTKGSWAQLTSATSFPVDEIVLWLAVAVAASATDTCSLLDIGIGGSGSETALISNINVGGVNAVSQWRFPIAIGSGVRVSARAQSAVTSKTFSVCLTLISFGGWDRRVTGTQATTYGANTADSSGVLLTSPGGNNAESAWTEITSSTTAPIRWLIPQFSGAQGNTAWTATNALVDIGVGGSGSEAVIVTDIPVNTSGAENLSYPTAALPVNIPTGSRLAARLQQASSAATSVEATVIGIN